MKRNIIQMSPSTKGITLPSPWIRKFSLEKGDKVHVQENGDSLVLSTNNDLQQKEITIRLDQGDKSFIQHQIYSAYQQGYDRIKIYFPQYTIDRWDDDKEIESRLVVQKTCDWLIGIEITKLEKNYAELRGIFSVYKFREFQNILRRTFMLLSNFGKESYVENKYRDQKRLDYASNQYKNLKKYMKFCNRYINKVGLGDDTSLYQDMVLRIDRIAVSFHFLLEMPKYIDLDTPMSEEGLQLFKDTLAMLSEATSLFNKFDSQKASRLYDERATLIKRSYALGTGDDKVSALSSMRLVEVLNNILHYMNASVHLHMKKGERK